MGLSPARISKGKLPMDETEKTKAAWGVVTTWNEEFTKREIAAMAGVSHTTVANMRAVQTAVLEQRPHLKDLSEFTWRQARELAKGNEVRADTGGREAQMHRMVDAFIKAFGVGGLSRDVPLTLEALRAYEEDLPDALRQCIEDDEAAEADGETEGASAAERLPFPEATKEAQARDF